MRGKWLVNVMSHICSAWHPVTMIGLIIIMADSSDLVNPFRIRFKLVMVHCTCLLRMIVFNTIKYPRGDPCA